MGMPSLLESRENMRTISLLAIAFLSFLPCAAHASESGPRELVSQVLETAGGEEKLLKLFRLRERLLVTKTPAEPVTQDEKGNRTSVVEVSGDWWVGKAKRDKDKVRVLCWAWSLRLLLDPQSTIQSCHDITVNGKPALGLRVTESVKQPIDLFFDADSKRLVAIDYDDTRHVFSEWKKTPDGHPYPSHVVGFRFTNRDAGTLASSQWYQTDILELTPLDELPTELKR
jgi:hypothetical protein